MNKKILVIFPLVFFTAIFLIYLDYLGIIWHNSLFALGHPVKGLDVSHHQGEINWQQVAATQKYTFIYMKATEGHDFIDSSFEKNWREAKETGFKVGAYHFFSMRSSGNTQAEYFISTVPNEIDSLAPVIDIEISLDHDPKLVQQEIKNMSDKLEAYYGKKTILYATYASYQRYIRGNFDNHKIWIRDIYKYPYLKEQNWTIWQYNNRGKVSGINSYVDINVLNGKLSELE